LCGHVKKKKKKKNAIPRILPEIKFDFTLKKINNNNKIEAALSCPMEQAKEEKRPIYTIVFCGLARPISMLDNPIREQELVGVPHMAATTGCPFGYFSCK
jgi:hypothetical protein